MYEYPERHRVAYDGSFDISRAPTKPDDNKTLDKVALKQRLGELNAEFAKLQEVLYADNRFSLLLVFQAMDAAGKDSTISAVTSGVNPAGFQVSAFKQPSAIELDHDFLWRTVGCLPERGRIGIFNRSHYEEVLVVRVHPEYLATQRLPKTPDSPKELEQLWKQRYESIREYEQHLARSGTVIIKFWLNVSKDEQKKRFLERLNEPDKNWKFAMGDLKERKCWPQYMEAYQEALQATSREYAPWYAIPADDKHYMRVAVAETIVKTLKALPLSYPKPLATELEQFASARQQLESED